MSQQYSARHVFFVLPSCPAEVWQALTELLHKEEATGFALSRTIAIYVMGNTNLALPVTAANQTLLKQLQFLPATHRAGQVLLAVLRGETVAAPTEGNAARGVPALVEQFVQAQNLESHSYTELFWAIVTKSRQHGSSYVRRVPFLSTFGDDPEDARQARIWVLAAYADETVAHAKYVLHSAERVQIAHTVLQKPRRQPLTTASRVAAATTAAPSTVPDVDVLGFLQNMMRQSGGGSGEGSGEAGPVFP
jgi:hypothetical protein